MTAAGCALIAVLLQWASGAWTAGWASDADTPAHLVTALMVRGYAREGVWAGQAPPEFAAEFYHRFPKVAFGHWPPLFHVALAAWTLATPLEQAWILGFQALLVGVVAGLTVGLGSRVLGVRRAMLAGLVVTLLPSTLEVGRTVMPDVMATAWVTAALAAFASYWRRPGWASSAVFGLCAAGALLTKPSGALLAMVPLLCLLLTRRWSLLKEKSFWLPVLLVAALYGPWHWQFTREMAEGWRGPKRIRTIYVDIPVVNALLVARAFGWTGLLVAAYGAWKHRMKGRWIVLCMAVAGAYLLFAFIVPVKGERHYLPVTPALAVLAVGGVATGARRWGRRVERAGYVILLAVILAGSRWTVTDSSLRELVSDLLVRQAPSRTWLVAGTPPFEGDAIAEAALMRPAGGLTVYRASKLVIDGDWSGWRERMTVGSAQEARDRLEQCGIEVAIIGPGTAPVLVEAFEGFPARWRAMKTRLRPGEGQVFERVGAARAPSAAPMIQKP